MARAKILSGKAEMLRGAMIGGGGGGRGQGEGEHTPVLINGDSLGFAKGARDDAHHDHQASGDKLLRSSVAGVKTFSSEHIPTDTELVALLRKVVKGGSHRVDNVTVAAEDEDMLVSFAQASRLCDLVFPPAVSSALVVAEEGKMMLEKTVTRQKIIAGEAACDDWRGCLHL